MVGKIMIRVRNLWIMIITALVLIIVAAVLLISGSQSKREIPQKGVFVLERGNLGAGIKQHCSQYPEHLVPRQAEVVEQGQNNRRRLHGTKTNQTGV